MKMPRTPSDKILVGLSLTGNNEEWDVTNEWLRQVKESLSILVGTSIPGGIKVQDVEVLGVLWDQGDGG